MVPSGRLLAFATVALIIIVIPGPSVLFVVGRALAHGRRVALASVLGNEAGSLVLMALVAAGVGPLLRSPPCAKRSWMIRAPWRI